MAKYTGEKRKVELNEMFGDKINLLQASRYLIEEFEDLYMADIKTDEVKNITLLLFSDCIIVVHNIKSLGKFTYFGHTEFHENSFVYTKPDLKYYN